MQNFHPFLPHLPTYNKVLVQEGGKHKASVNNLVGLEITFLQ